MDSLNLLLFVSVHIYFYFNFLMNEFLILGSSFTEQFYYETQNNKVALLHTSLTTTTTKVRANYAKFL